MVEWEYIEFTKSHKHIKNASTCETIVTENELKTGIRILTQSKMQECSTIWASDTLKQTYSAIDERK